MSEHYLIPKKIHYVWVGGNKKPELIRKCINSWQNILSDYEIIEWNESNFDIEINEYAKQAYNYKKWAFVSDYIRFYVLYHYGGIYLDTDVEVLKSLDPMLHNGGFAGFENDIGIAPGLILGSKKKSCVIKKLLDGYADRKFVKSDGSLDTSTVVRYATKLFVEMGFNMNGMYQCINGFHVYPSEYFCPMNYITGEIKITPNTYTIHHYAESWLSGKSKKKSQYRKLAIKILGHDTFKKIKRIVQR